MHAMEARMKAVRTSFLLISILLIASFSFGQITHISIAAGTDEDKALQAISSETDAQKKIAMLQKFIEDYASIKPAAAYGYWQMLQVYQAAGENDKALAAGEKAAELAPGNLDILVSICGVAQSLNAYEKVVEFAAKGGAAYHGIATQLKPAEISAEEWASRISTDQNSAKQSFEFLEAAAINALSSETDPRKRLNMVEAFTSGFPNSRYDVQVSQLAMAALQQLNDTAKSVEFGEKALKANPNSVPTLLLLANAYAGDPKNAGKGVEYAERAVKLAVVDTDTTPEQKLTAGVARSTLGFALLNQDKTLAAIPELKQAVELLQGNDSVSEEALYRLGFAYAKLGRRAEAQAALQKCIALKGAYLAMAQDLLGKVSGGARKK
jgi:tetratricopeptide (TPR) repeat protein